MHNPLEQTTSRTQSCVEALRQLPAEAQPPYHWQEFHRRSQIRRSATGPVGWGYVAAAAAVLLVVCAIAVWGRVGNPGSGRQLVVDSGAPGGTPSHRSQGGEGPFGDIDALRELQWWAASETPDSSGEPESASRELTLATSRSQAIESWLATLPREPVVVRVGTRADVARLEDRIAQVDDLLTSVSLEGVRPDRVVALQRERTRLVGSLAQVRYAEVLTAESP